MKFKWTLRLTILTPLIMLVSLVTAGGGHGIPFPTLACYPILFLADAFSSGGGPLVWAVLLGQFPMYGLIIDIGKSTSRQILAMGLLILLHTILILITATNTEFWKHWE